MLEYCGLFTLFLRRAAMCFTHVQGEVESAPTYVATIFSLNKIGRECREDKRGLTGCHGKKLKSRKDISGAGDSP